MLVVGIDPGLSGAVVSVEPGRVHRAERDFKEGEDIVEAVRRVAPSATYAVIEKVGARPGQGVCSMFSFGQSTGIAIGAVLAQMPEKPLRPTPQAWQKVYRQALRLDPKHRFGDITQDVARIMFPADTHLFARKKDHNTADACLIALWGWLQFNPLAAAQVFAGR